MIKDCKETKHNKLSLYDKVRIAFLYSEERKTYAEISDILNVEKSKVSSFLNEYGLVKQRWENKALSTIPKTRNKGKILLERLSDSKEEALDKETQMRLEQEYDGILYKLKFRLFEKQWVRTHPDGACSENDQEIVESISSYICEAASYFKDNKNCSFRTFVVNKTIFLAIDDYRRYVLGGRRKNERKILFESYEDRVRKEKGTVDSYDINVILEQDLGKDEASRVWRDYDLSSQSIELESENLTSSSSRTDACAVPDYLATLRLDMNKTDWDDLKFNIVKKIIALHNPIHKKFILSFFLDYLFPQCEDKGIIDMKYLAKRFSVSEAYMSTVRKAIMNDFNVKDIILSSFDETYMDLEEMEKELLV